jgi:phosphate transport system ATP-binding protein
MVFSNPTAKSVLTKACDGGLDADATRTSASYIRPSETSDTLIQLVDFSACYGELEVLKNINLSVERKKITVLMGPPRCGKSTLVRSLNRMNDDVPGFGITGKVFLDGEDIYAPTVDPVLLKTRVGIVLQKPNPFPISIYDNVAFGPRIHRLAKTNDELDGVVRDSLQKATLWDEVKDSLNKNAWGLSGGQAQRLCIAMALAVRPEVIVMDESTSALDPGSTSKMEELMVALKENYTIILITHDVQQAARVGTSVAFLHEGDLIEFGPSKDVLENPRSPLAKKYFKEQGSTLGAKEEPAFSGLDSHNIPWIKCSFCGESYSASAIGRHLELEYDGVGRHLESHDKEGKVNSTLQQKASTGKESIEKAISSGKTVHLAVKGSNGLSTYWMHLDADSNSTSKQLDAFLRGTWAEYSGRLSQVITDDESLYYILEFRQPINITRF